MLLTTATLMGLMALATCCRGDAFEQKVLRAGGAATEKRVAIIGEEALLLVERMEYKNYLAFFRRRRCWDFGVVLAQERFS